MYYAILLHVLYIIFKLLCVGGNGGVVYLCVCACLLSFYFSNSFSCGLCCSIQVIIHVHVRMCTRIIIMSMYMCIVRICVHIALEFLKIVNCEVFLRLQNISYTFKACPSVQPGPSMSPTHYLNYTVSPVTYLCNPQICAFWRKMAICEFYLCVALHGAWLSIP